MYMHTKWLMQFCHKRCKKICAHFLHYYVVKASHGFFCLASGKPEGDE